MERINEKTPNGGEYTEVYFYDAQFEPTTKDKAVHFEIKEYDEKGNMIASTIS
jgi:hypothetical protein